MQVRQRIGRRVTFDAELLLLLLLLGPVKRTMPRLHADASFSSDQSSEM
jgi:hypothetical protein